MGSHHPAAVDALASHPIRPVVITRRDALRRALVPVRRAGKRIALVPTMGALHEGHLSLVDAARAECDFTVVTVFVNPVQFGPTEDLADYPRTPEADRAALCRRQVDLMFAPAVAEIYRPGHETYVEVGDTAVPLEGEFRLGHFRGVATVVLKLLNLVQPDVAYFGSKDYQQSLVVRRLVDDFEVPVEIRTCATVREADGLAMSSRNAYLHPTERGRALALPRSLHLAAELVAAGEHNVGVIRRRVVEQLRAAGGVEVQYVAFVRAGTVTPVECIDGPTVMAIAAVVGKTRLIDNRVIG